MVAAVIRAQGDAAGLRFSSQQTAGGQFDAVRHGIADQMDQRVRNLLNDVVVEFGFASEKLKFDQLAGGLGGVANRARQPRIEGANGQHAGGGNFVLQVMRKLGEFVDVAFDAADEAAELR